MKKDSKVHKRTKKRKSKIEFSKRWTSVILATALVDIQLTYILAFLDRQLAETLSVALVTEVIGVVGIYSAKAYLGKRNEEANKLSEKEMETRQSEKEWEEQQK